MNSIWSRSSAAIGTPWVRRVAAAWLGGRSAIAPGCSGNALGAGGGVGTATEGDTGRGAGGEACHTRVPITAPATASPITPAEIQGQTVLAPAATVAFDAAASAASVFAATPVAATAAVTPSARAIRADAAGDGPFWRADSSRRLSKSLASAASKGSGRSAGGRFMTPLPSGNPSRRALPRRGTVLGRDAGATRRCPAESRAAPRSPATSTLRSRRARTLPPDRYRPSTARDRRAGCQRAVRRRRGRRKDAGPYPRPAASVRSCVLASAPPAGQLR